MKTVKTLSKFIPQFLGNFGPAKSAVAPPALARVNVPAAEAGLPDRKEENERISWDILGYQSDNWWRFEKIFYGYIQSIFWKPVLSM